MKQCGPTILDTLSFLFVFVSVSQLSLKETTSSTCTCSALNCLQFLPVLFLQFKEVAVSAHGGFEEGGVSEVREGDVVEEVLLPQHPGLEVVV